MHRMKIGLVAAAVLLVFTLGVHAVVTQNLKESVIHEVESDVSRAQRMHQSIARLESLDFANLVAGLAHRPAVVGVFDKTDETAKRQAAFEQCEGLNAYLQSGSRKADIVAVIDSTGKVVARDLNVERDVRRGSARQVPRRRRPRSRARRPRTSGRSPTA